MVAVFGDIGQMREITEGPDHHHRLLTAEAFQQFVETLARLRIALEPERHRQLADALDQLVGLMAFLFADDLAQNPAEQADVIGLGRVLRLALVLERGFRYGGFGVHGLLREIS